MDLDIDRYINRMVPQSRLYLFPKPVSWVLGYRSDPSHQPPIKNVLVWLWAFIGAVAGVLTVEAVFRTSHFQARGAPIIIASLGATAILEYNTIDSPLAQPRNAFFGQILAATIGIGITKLFHLSPDFENLRWIAGALSVGVSSAVMGATKTIHPPAGATALLAATSAEIMELGWFFIPLVILGTSLMLAVSCLLMNIQRRFPQYWFTPPSVNLKPGDAEKQISTEHIEELKIVIKRGEVLVPKVIVLDADEKVFLEVLQRRLGEHLQSVSSRDTGETHVE